MSTPSSESDATKPLSIAMTCPSGEPVEDDEEVAFSILALYKFFLLPEPVSTIKARLEDFLRPRLVRGLLLLAAEEGINGTISYPTVYDVEIRNFLKTSICLEDLNEQEGGDRVRPQYQNLRLCVSHNNPRHVFHRLKIEEKKEIVSMTGGIPLRHIIPSFLEISCNDGADKESRKSESVDPNLPSTGLQDDNQGVAEIHDFSRDGDELAVGNYVKPGAEWHALLKDPNCWVIDMRNDYEIALGTFPNSTNPGTTSFTEFPSWFQDQLERRPGTFDKVAMFCTGGIRCEKASAYCLSKMNPPDQASGTPTSSPVPVYHLEGGILSYLKQIPESQSMWEGDCYVFDQRTAVTQGLRPSSRFTTSCNACRHPLTPEDQMTAEYRQGISCPYCMSDPDREQLRQRYLERQKQVDLAQENNTKHIHDHRQECFTKSRAKSTAANHQNV